jgi:acyl-CoA synthetase (AMP-forming)/AMP-acid ligase II
MYNLCLIQTDCSQFDLSNWRIGAFGGAIMPQATIDMVGKIWKNLTLLNVYGATETTSPATILPPGASGAHLDSVGKAVPCGEIAIMNDAGQQVPPGSAGELWIRGPMVVKGYWNNPAATKECFVSGFWKSGDIGSIDENGFVSVFDRKKDMINRGGFKIYSSEVENVLCQHPDVFEAAVVGKPCPVLGERVHAFVVLREVSVSELTLRAYCAERLTDYQVPESFTFSTSPLPRNANGKVLKRDLRIAPPT